MTIEVGQLHDLFGVEMSGIAMDRAISNEDRDRLIDLMQTHGLVLIRDQFPTQEQLGEFAASLGTIWRLNQSMMEDSATIKSITDAVYHYTDRDEHGQKLAGDDPAIQILKNNMHWHTDATYSRPRPLYSIFMGRIVPPEGGDTQFCDTRVAFETLPAERQEELRGIAAYHSVLTGLSRIGREDKIKGDDRERYSGQRRLLVESHVSGREALVLAHYIYRIGDMTAEKSEELRLELEAHATRPEHVYTHKWRAGDALLWDNRCTLHRATPYDLDAYTRDMWTVRTADMSMAELSLAK